MQKLKNKKLPTSKKVKINTGAFAMEGALFGLQIPLNLKDCINLRNGASKEVVKELDAMALKEMSSYSELHKQSGAINSPQGYVTREAKISCSYGKGYYVTMLDARKDYGAFAANGKPLLTCKDCLAEINIHSFGNCFAEIESGRKFPRLSGTRVGNIGGKWIYKCIPEPVGQWRQKESVLELGDGEDGKYSVALTAGACLICRYGGKIEILEVPEMDNEEPEQILPLESKWLEEHTAGLDYKEYVTIDFLEELEWNEIADYYFDIANGERSDWEEVYNPDDGTFNPDPQIDRHERPIDKQDIVNLNRVLMLYDITTIERISAFISQITYECTHGKYMCERVGNGEDNQPDDITRTAMEKWLLENNLNEDGELKYPYKYRGGGTIHLTHDYNYKTVSENIGDEKVLSVGTEYVAYTYPWLSAGIFWDHCDMNTILKNQGIREVVKTINRKSSNIDARVTAYNTRKSQYEKSLKDRGISSLDQL